MIACKCMAVITESHTHTHGHDGRASLASIVSAKRRALTEVDARANTVQGSYARGPRQPADDN